MTRPIDCLSDLFGVVPLAGLITMSDIDVPLSPRSAYHISGEARYDWEHSITELTETRWPITFRSLSAAGLNAMRRAALVQS